MDYIIAIVIIFLLLWRMTGGFKRGLVGEVAALLSLITTGICILLILAAIGSYWEEKMGNMVLMIAFLFLICLVYKLIHTLFTSIHLISKLPVISIANKLLGAAAGLAEALVIVWLAVYVADFAGWPVPDYLHVLQWKAIDALKRI